MSTITTLSKEGTLGRVPMLPVLALVACQAETPTEIEEPIQMSVTQPGPDAAPMLKDPVMGPDFNDRFTFYVRSVPAVPLYVWLETFDNDEASVIQVDEPLHEWWVCDPSSGCYDDFVGGGAGDLMRVFSDHSCLASGGVEEHARVRLNGLCPSPPLLSKEFKIYCPFSPL